VDHNVGEEAEANIALTLGEGGLEWVACEGRGEDVAGAK